MSSESPANAFARATRARIAAPAGCGKTELIADAVMSCGRGRQLILTHTNAGVRALRRRLERKRVPTDRYLVETIAGWGLRYAKSFPRTSGAQAVPNTPTGSQWNEVYKCAAHLLKENAARRLVRASYTGLFVDEYQDCIKAQHQLVLQLAELLPCRLVGDPLQAIFGFTGELVDWDDTAAFPGFSEIPCLATPYRWRGRNEALGKWLLSIRSALLAGDPLNLQTDLDVVKWVPITNQAPVAVCRSVLRHGGSVVALRSNKNEAHSSARRLGGLLSSMEEMECSSLMDACESIQGSRGSGRALAVLKFAKECLTEVSTALGSVIARLEDGGEVGGRKGTKNGEVLDALWAIERDDDIQLVAPALRALERVPGARAFRRELLREMHRTLTLFSEGKYARMQEAAWAVRNRLRYMGRRTEANTVSRTLLVKGLEFDHTIVLNGDEWDRRNLYVALTRGSRSLTVLSRQPILKYKI